MEQPNYYSILPASVRYCEDISAGEKILFSEITALCNTQGYCWAGNRYFSDLYKMAIGSISRMLSNLQKSGFLRIETNPKDSSDRKIFLTEKMILPIHKNVNPPTQKCEPPYTKMLTPLHKNVKHNTKYNTKPNTIETNVSIVAEKSATTQKEKKIRTKKLIVPDGTFEERKESFKVLLRPFVEKYGKDMIVAFGKHWCEKEQGAEKMRFEYEKFFEVSKRLSTWKKRERPKFDSQQNEKPKDEMIGRNKKSDLEKFINGEN